MSFPLDVPIEILSFLRNCDIHDMFTLGTFDWNDLQEMATEGLELHTLRMLHRRAQNQCVHDLRSISKKGSSSMTVPLDRTVPRRIDSNFPTQNRGSSCLAAYSSMGFRPQRVSPVLTTSVIPKGSTHRNHTEHIERLWTTYCNLGSSGSLWDAERFNSVESRPMLKEVLTSDWNESTQLGQILSTLDAWIAFATKEGRNWRTPDYISVKLFLTSYASRGATVPKAKYHALRWLESHIGLAFNCDAKHIRTAAQEPSTHVPRQADPIRMVLWCKFEALLSSDNIFVVAVAFYWCMIIVTVLRPKHLNISRIRLLDSYFEGFVALGKSKIGGRRRPFWWGAPRTGVSGIDLGAVFRRLSSKIDIGTDEMPGLLMDIEPPWASFACATSFASYPMPRHRLLKLTTHMLQDAGVPLSLINQVEGLYSARRVLPTLADFARYSDSERLDVGGWYSKAAHSASSMPNRYSAARQYVQADLKFNLIQSAALAWRSFGECVPSATNPEWTQLFSFWPSDPRRRLCGSPAESWPALVQCERPCEASSSSSAGCPASNSSEDSGDERAFGAEADEPFSAASSALEWQLARGARGRLHLCIGDTAELACGRSLHMPECGQGLYAAADTGHAWSPRCFARLPADSATWWAANHQTTGANDD